MYQETVVWIREEEERIGTEFVPHLFLLKALCTSWIDFNARYKCAVDDGLSYDLAVALLLLLEAVALVVLQDIV